MNKKTISRCMMLLLLAVMSVHVQGQQLHTIIFADTNDRSIGKSVLQDYYSISVEASTIASAIGMQLKSYYFKGDQCSNANLRKVLNQLRTESDDVILFYYTGHGTRSQADVSEFPQMCLGSNRDNDFYPLEKVLQQLNEQPARLKIVIGDCCNNVVNGVTPKDYQTRSATVLTKGPVDVYNNLFANNRGFMIASGSTKGETSVGWSSGGAFTISLLGVLKHYATNGLSATWDYVMADTRATTFEYAKHTPVYSVNIREAETATATPQYQEPQNTAVDDGSEDIEKITILTAIGNENVSIDTRVKIQDKALKALFSNPNVKVEVVGSNGMTIVATEKASDFVLRLCTAHNLVNLVEVDKTEDNSGRYTYLKVHEIYKK